MFREFKVGVITSKQTKEVTAYFVTDANDDSEIESRPKAADFPVSVLFDKGIQHQRATDYCAYLNKLVAASKEAYEQNQLINILKS
jgi:hypothetical protein